MNVYSIDNKEAMKTEEDLDKFNFGFSDYYKDQINYLYLYLFLEEMNKL
jgi:hypothetical protein